MIGGLLALSALLARTPALNLTPSALARRRLEKSSIYLFRKRLSGLRDGHANSDNSADRSPFADHPAHHEHPVTVLSRRTTHA